MKSIAPVFRQINWKSAFNSLSRSSLIVYLIALALVMSLTDHRKVRTRILNSSRIPLQYLVEYSEGFAEFDREKFKTYIDYYDYVIKYIHNATEAYGILAYCHYQLGHEKKAKEYYREALKLNNQFFWFYYDLGLLEFKDGEYKSAVEHLERAVSLPPMLTIDLLSNSRILVDFGNYEETLINSRFTLMDLGKKIDSNLQAGYENSYALIALSYLYLEDYEKLKEKTWLFLSYLKEDRDKYAQLFCYLAGRAYYHLGVYPEALSFLKESAGIDSRHADTYYYTGLALKAVNEKELSHVAFTTAEALRKLNPKDIITDFVQELKPRLF